MRSFIANAFEHVEHIIIFYCTYFKIHNNFMTTNNIMNYVVVFANQSKRLFSLAYTYLMI